MHLSSSKEMILTRCICGWAHFLCIGVLSHFFIASYDLTIAFGVCMYVDVKYESLTLSFIFLYNN